MTEMTEDANKHRAFEEVFRRFDHDNRGSINTKDFLNIIDELDALQPEEAEPIISEEQRGNAVEVVEAGLTMSKKEVLEFLEELGVDLGEMKTAPKPVLPSKIPRPDVSISSPLSNVRPRSRPTPSRLDRPRRPQRPTTPDVSAIESAGVETSKPETSPRHSGVVGRRADSPLAQSTPHRVTADMGSKEDRRPLSGTRRDATQSLFSAVADGAYSPPATSSPRSFSGSPLESMQVLQLQDEIRALQDREKGNERMIAASEHQIHQVESLLEQAREELGQRSKLVADLRSSCTTAEHTIHLLERDVEDANKEKMNWQQRHAKMREEIDSHLSENEKLKSLCQERSYVIDDLKAKLATTADDGRLWAQEKLGLMAQISGLEIQCNRLVDTESQLSEALEACRESEKQIDQLKCDIEQIKKASIRSTRLTSTSDQLEMTRSPLHEQPKSRAVGAQIAPDRSEHGVQTDTVDQAPSSHIGTSSTSLDNPDLPGGPSQEEMMKQHYATLSNELGLQRSLIDKMISMKTNPKKTKPRPRHTGPVSSSNLQSSTLPLEPNQVKQRSITSDHLTWPIIVLYSLVFVLLGYLLSSHAVTSSASGVSYAELRSWDRANAIEHLLDHHGVLTSGGGLRRWWEGGWRWVEMVGYWLEDRLLDAPWPS